MLPPRPLADHAQRRPHVLDIEVSAQVDLTRRRGSSLVQSNLRKRIEDDVVIRLDQRAHRTKAGRPPRLKNRDKENVFIFVAKLRKNPRPLKKNRTKQFLIFGYYSLMFDFSSIGEGVTQRDSQMREEEDESFLCIWYGRI